MKQEGCPGFPGLHNHRQAFAKFTIPTLRNFGGILGALVRLLAVHLDRGPISRLEEVVVPLSPCVSEQSRPLQKVSVDLDVIFRCRLFIKRRFPIVSAVENIPIFRAHRLGQSHPPDNFSHLGGVAPF